MGNKTQNAQKYKWVKVGRNLERVAVPANNEKDRVTKSKTDETTLESAPAQEGKQANDDVRDTIDAAMPGPSNAEPPSQKRRVEPPESKVMMRKGHSFLKQPFEV